MKTSLKEFMKKTIKVDVTRADTKTEYGNISKLVFPSVRNKERS
jgi:hypothetical protein